MAQGYDKLFPPNTAETFGNFAGKARTNQSAMNSLHAGSSAPTNPEDRQLWLDTSVTPNLLKIYDAATTTWKTLDFLDVLVKEVVDARGTASRLDARIDVSLNEDGTLKASTTLNPDEFKAVTGTPTRTAGTTFTKSGDQSQIYTVNRRVKMSPGPNYSRVTTVSFAAGTTTVIVADSNVPVGITAADVGIIDPTASTTGVDAKGLASPSGGVIEDYLAELVTARDGKTNLNARIDRTIRHPQNLLRNGNFERWAAGTSVAPDSWTLTGTGATIAKETTTVKRGAASAKPNTDGINNAILSQNFFDAYFKGRKVTFGCWLHSATAARLRLRIDDGVGTTDSSYHTGGGSWEFIKVTRTLDAGATKVEAQIRLEAGAAIAVYADGAISVEGDEAYAFAQHPADAAAGVGVPGPDFHEFHEITAPANPAADKARLYAKDDGGTTRLAYKDSAGVETILKATGTIACGLRNSADISISSASSTVVTFDTEDFDTDTMHSLVSNTGRITFTTAGRYWVYFEALFNAHATGIRQARLRLNGATQISDVQLPNNGSATGMTVFTGAFIDAVANDYVEALVEQNSGGALSLVQNTTRAIRFGATKL